MNKLLEGNDKLIAIAAVAFAIGYSLVNCDLNSYASGFASGIGALIALDMWFDD